MALSFNRDDVLRLAPDAGSAKSGQELAQPRKWTMLGGDEDAIWGHCQGSGSKPYQVQIDLSEPAFKCSCPSRKFPCKHGLGLLLIYASTPAAVAKSERPAWVNEWLQSRQTRAAKAQEKQQRAEEMPPDPAAQAKRLAQRLKRVRAGIGELAAWTQDLVNSGIGAAPSKGFDFFDSQARRMVDAQAPGIARMLRELGSTASSGAGWQRRFAEQLALVHLTTRAVDGFDRLPERAQADVRSVLGIPVINEELVPLPGLRDRWQVVAQAIEVEDRLRAQRNWLFGVDSRRVAMVLQFAHGAAAFDDTLALGTEIDGELVFFPGNGLRASLQSNQSAVTPIHEVQGFDSLDAALDFHDQTLASFPWLERVGLPLLGMTPAMQGDRWWITDSVHRGLPLRMTDAARFVLLAISGGAPINLVAEFDGREFRPLSVIEGDQWISLSSSSLELDTT